MGLTFGKNTTVGTVKKPRKRRRGIHAKTKTSKLKSSNLYVKKYKGQGK